MIGVWDVQTRQHVHSFGAPEQGDLWCLQFSPDGQRLLSASNDYAVKVWPWHADDLRQVNSPLLELPMVRVDGQWNRATFTHDGKRIITGGEGHTVKIWDATSGDLLLTLSGHTGDAYAVAVSPDGRWLASGGEDTTIRLWDAETGEAKYKLRGHVGVINSLAFSRDSRLLASGCRDNTVKVWQLDRIAAQIE
jgi:WD40 repeat protein